jgi:hypothetical protein
MKTFVELEHMAFVELRDDGQDFWPSEFNPRHNKISRSKIRTMKREQGSCWIWHVNPGPKGTPIVREYRRGMVFNFGGSFITPKYDTKLEAMIRERLDAPYTGTKDDAKRVDAIYEYADTLGMAALIWS